ncbi:MAG: DUF4040 domain-containing protein [Planctomycetes bacterium]|nr:DUF4040 domain-containing protein [Planctomycetota bacterium]
MIWWLVDLLLVAALIGLAWHVVRGGSLFRSVVWFLAYGLFMALAWVRLGAADVALAEAAIGAGVTGALLLAAARQMERRLE